jgi:hypothetical protein
MGRNRPPADDFIAAQNLYRIFVAFRELNANDNLPALVGRAEFRQGGMKHDAAIGNEKCWK